MSALTSVALQLPYRLAIGASSAVAIAALAARTPAPVAVAPPAPVVTETVAPVAAPPVRSSELWFVFSARGDSFLRLAPIAGADEDNGGIAMPPHQALAHLHEDGVEISIADLAKGDEPAAYAAWRGRRVKVDNTCEATIVGFSVVARLTGDPAYADKQVWDADTVFAAGHPMLAAELDGCTGTFARSAALPDVAMPIKLHDAALEQAAIEALIASAPAREVDRAWAEQSAAQDAKTVPWRDPGTVVAEVLRHPGTGETFVSVHGHVSGGCGDPTVNVWGLFRAHDGALEPLQLRALEGEDIDTIITLLDVEGDGEFELLGRPWLGDGERLIRANGDPMAELSLSFFGCPC